MSDAAESGASTPDVRHRTSDIARVPCPVIPFVAPPVWPDVPPGRFAASIYRNSTELLDSPEALRQTAAKCAIGLLGLTDDTGVELNHGRTGAREGPHAFRQALARYGVAAPMWDRLPQVAGCAGGAPPTDANPANGVPRPAYPHVFDAGDITPGRDIHEMHDRVTAAVTAMMELGLFPVGIGGGHDLTYPFVRAVARRLGAMDGVYFDAHLDVRPAVGSGMPFRKLLEDRFASRLTCIGVNPLVNTDEHAAWFVEHGGSFERFSPERWPAGGRQFVSLDLDVLDSAYAPGVSALNPCGMTPSELGGYARAAGRAPGVRCFDIMELNPRHDHEGRTARIAAHLFLEFLRGFSERDAEGRR